MRFARAATTTGGPKLMVMIFAHPRVRAHLLEKGMVYSFRKHHKKTSDGIRPQTGKDWATDRRTGKKIADIHVAALEPIDSLNMEQVLEKYVPESGFYQGDGPLDDAILEWTQAINDLNPDAPIAGWIYQIDVLGNQASNHQGSKMGWRIFMRTKLDSDEWGGTRPLYDWETALDGYMRLEEYYDDIDIMLVKIERYSAATNYKNFKKPDMQSPEQTQKEAK